jgi:hypothetical protein
MLRDSQILDDALRSALLLQEGGFAMFNENLNRRITIEESPLSSGNGGEIVGEEFMDCCYWDEALKRKLRKTVPPATAASYSSKQMQLMVDFAWFDNPRRPLNISIWDETAKQKMRKPVRTNGNHIFDDLRLAIMIGLAGS